MKILYCIQSHTRSPKVSIIHYTVQECCWVHVPNFNWDNIATGRFDQAFQLLYMLPHLKASACSISVSTLAQNPKSLQHCNTRELSIRHCHASALLVNAIVIMSASTECN